MLERRTIDITELAVLGERFPLRLLQLGFRLMQAIDETGRDQFRYVVPPVCEVPAGPFVMGSDKRKDPQASNDELPQRTVMLQAYKIGAYPLTVAEWAYAVRAGVVDKPTRLTPTWQEQLTHLEHPVVCISWQQVMQYITWLNHMTDQEWRMPSEAEWEKAARGTDGRIYPWGNQWDGTRANIDDRGVGIETLVGTTPVGTYAEQGDASPYGCHDLAGNVWELTSSLWGNDPHVDDTQHEHITHPTTAHVLRGGSWDSYPREARVADRGRLLPPGRGDLIGARLAVSLGVCEVAGHNDPDRVLYGR
jgi:formylglycine-generating enzyme required for sulfatase activity